MDTYDNAGNTTTHVTGAGQRIGFQYDALNRMTAKTAPVGPTK